MYWTLYTLTSLNDLVLLAEFQFTCAKDGSLNKLSRLKHFIRAACVAQIFGDASVEAYWSEILLHLTTTATHRLLTTNIISAVLSCPVMLSWLHGLLFVCRNWLPEWTSLPTPAYRTIPSGPTSSSGKPPSTARSRARSEPCILTPQREREAILAGWRCEKSFIYLLL